MRVEAAPSQGVAAGRAGAGHWGTIRPLAELQATEITERNQVCGASGTRPAVAVQLGAIARKSLVKI